MINAWPIKNRLMENNLPHKMLLKHMRPLRNAGMIVIAVCILCFLLLTSQQSNIEIPFSPYLGQTPPSNTPELFAEGIIPADLHSVPVFSPNLGTIYYKSMDADEIMVIRHGNDGWSEAEPLFDPQEMEDSDDPCFNPRGDKLFFSAYNKDKNREFIYC